MNYVVAVSGGVDSVVLLDVVSRQKHINKIIVAHFDHGMREDSAADARFVAALARNYKLPCESQREELGASASEAVARERRYTFLRTIAAKHNARIVTAHHADDLVETIAINFARGTGWRGLAAFGDTNILRPFLSKRKEALYKYASANQLEWIEDETNKSDRYLRNRLRKKTMSLDVDKTKQIQRLYQNQLFLRDQIVKEVLLHKDNNSRYFFIMISDAIGLELMRAKMNGRLTSPQLRVLLHGIKTAKAGSIVTPGAGMRVQINQTDFIIETAS